MMEVWAAVLLCALSGMLGLVIGFMLGGLASL